MYKNIIFVGGIHGVGKSSLCLPAAQRFGIEYLSASEVLRWKEVSDASGDKYVEDLGLMQKRLMEGLKRKIEEDIFYILDGHYCLFDAIGAVAQIPESTFFQMNPTALFVIVNDTSIVAERLRRRDNRAYSEYHLAEMQHQEVDYARALAGKLQVPLHELHSDASDVFQETLLMYIK